VTAIAGIEENVPLAPMTSYRIGGPADYFTQPSRIQELIRALEWAKNEDQQVFIMGAGTNVLFSDGGYKGLIVQMRQFNSDLGEPSADGIWEISSGAMLTSLVRRAIWRGYEGIEDLAGIPGTLGGALRMNAGAFKQEISQTLTDIDILSDEFEVQRLNAANIGFAYRKAPGLAGKTIISARLQLRQCNRDDLIDRMRSILQLRREKQPLQFASCGSVFKRPEGDFAGRLIEEAGLKGLTCSDAQISDKHANFFINKGNASATDLLYIIKAAKKKVKEEFDVELKREVILLGFTEEELNGT